MDYRLAAEVKGIADGLVWEHHEDLLGRGPRIVYVMTSSANPPRKMFKISKISGLPAFLALDRKPEKPVTEVTPATYVPQAEPFVVIEVAQFWWNTLEPWQRVGLVDHVLSHLRFDPDDDSWSIEPPPFGEFPAVLERNGDWRPDNSFRRFAQKVSMQLSLALDDEDDGERKEDAEGGDEGERAGQDALDHGYDVDPETGEVLEGARA